MNNNSIGIFDSGLGGLSVFKEITELLPFENIIYVSDSKYCPYGNKTDEYITERSKVITNFLLSKKCKLIVVACNTATTASIALLRELYIVPFVGMEPAIKPAARLTKTGKVGILATEGTLKGNHYKKTKEKYASNIETIIQPGHGLVELVEQGLHNTKQGEELIKKHTEGMIAEGVDYIVLGCTHYPFFYDTLKRVLPPEIEIVNPAPAVAQRVKNILSEGKILKHESQSEYQFYTSGDKDTFANFLKVEFNIIAEIFSDKTLSD